MSRRYKGAILSPSSTNPSLPVSGVWTLDQQSNAKGAGLWPTTPTAPTIGTATAGYNVCVSVAFTPPTCYGAPLPITFVATSTPGCITGTATASPVVVTGLTPGTPYTFKVKAVAPGGAVGPESAASNSVTPFVTGQTAYTTAGTYSFVVPTGVTSVSMVTVGGGGGGGWPYGAGGGGGGALAYVNNVAVTPGATIAVTVGAGGSGATSQFSAGYPGGFSQVVYSGTTRARANGGAGGYQGVPGGTVAAGTGGSGGSGGYGQEPGGGGGGAGGYSGNGGNGGNVYGSGPTNGAGGGGNGGGAGYYNEQCWGSGCGSFYVKDWYGGANGGGVSILGLNASCANYGYGAGGGGAFEAYFQPYVQFPGGPGGGGAVRIIYPGSLRSFPSTNAGNL